MKTVAMLPAGDAKAQPAHPDGTRIERSPTPAERRAARRRAQRRARQRRSRRTPGPLTSLLQYGAFRAGLWLPSVLPLWAAMRLGECVAYLVYLTALPLRRVGFTNLAIAFPNRSRTEHRRILRASFLNLGRMFAEVSHLHRITPENVRDWVTIEDPEFWRTSLEANRERGLFVLTGHFGNWELFAYAHGVYGHPVHLIYRALRNPRIDAFIDRFRKAAGTVTLRKSMAGLGVARAVRSGKIIAIPADQNSTRQIGTFVDFFGRPASTNRGLASLALRTGLPVFPAFLVREGRGARHRIVVGRPIPIARTGDFEADVRENTQRFAHALEAMIVRHPDHWLWVHKRWKTRPVGEARFY